MKESIMGMRPSLLTFPSCSAPSRSLEVPNTSPAIWQYASVWDKAVRVSIGGVSLEQDPRHGPPQFFGSPSTVVAMISPEPRLAPIPVKIDFVGYRQSDELSYSYYIEYTEKGRNDRSATFSGKSNGLSFYADFQGLILGGQLNIEVSMLLQSEQDGSMGQWQALFTGAVHGRNPDKSAIRDLLPSDELRVIAFKESRFMQFEHNLPKWGEPNGFGVMQLDKPRPSATELWDWKANVESGKKLFLDKIQLARTYPGRVRRKDKFEDAKDFTEEELKMDTYSLYRGGHYWKWDDKTKQWKRRISENNKDGPTYADSAFEIEKAVKGGNPPREWE